MGRRRRSRAAAVAAIVAATVLSPVPAAATPTRTCSEVSIPLQNALSGLHVSAQLCGVSRDPGRQTIEVLVPGYTYGQAYWDFPYRPATYSYARAANAAGYATLNLFRLGTGTSSHPPVQDLTLDNQVDALHQVLRAVRAGQVGGARFGRIVAVGHSLGSAMVSAAQVKHADADAVILTGYSHGVDPVGIGAFEAAATYPARGESRFAGRPDGYLTTLPGTRAALFYWPGTMEPAVVRTDEATKETTGEIVEASGITVVEAMAGTPAITVPVLVAVGELDTIVCGLPACLQAEPAYYGRPDLVSTISMPDTGHDLNLSYSAPDFFAQVNRWLAS